MDTIRVMGLTRLDGLELKKKVPDADLKFESATGGDAKHGELAIWAIVVLTLAGLKLLAAWLMKNQNHGRLTHNITLTNSRGDTRTENFEMEFNESTSEADVVNALAKLMKVDPGLLPEK
jgi:hypothetical protein